MAAPRNGLSAHQHDSFALGECNAPVQVLSEHGRLHVIGIPAKTGIPPSHVRGVWLGTPQPSQSSHVPVVNPSAMERRRQLVSIELLNLARPRDRPHINDPADAMSFQESDEVLYRPCRVTDREHDY